jgi:hypothetical protein
MGIVSMNRSTNPSHSALGKGRPAATSIALMLITVVAGSQYASRMLACLPQQ